MNSARNEGSRFPSHEHDHRHCVASALDDAKAVCSERGARLTPVRQRVLEIIWQSHRPLGAYAILDVLSGEGHSPAPPTVYRALEFLLMHGLVHRLSSLNAFIGCARPGHPGAGQFLLCTNCGAAAELNDAAVERAMIAADMSRARRAARIDRAAAAWILQGALDAMGVNAARGAPRRPAG